MKPNWLRLSCCVLLATSCLSVGPTFAQDVPAGAGADERVRTIVTTDPELDDLNSLIRFLLYSNGMDVEALITASGAYHWKGDGQGTEFFMEGRQYTRPGVDLCPCTEWRWYDTHIQDVIAAYASAYDNLVVHDPAYPSPDDLLARTYEGNVEFDSDISKDSEGSDVIKAALLDDDERPLYLQSWGGPSTIARALLSIEEEFADTADWQDIQERISQKAVIVAFGAQDYSYRDYISPKWPDIQFWELSTSIWGYPARNVVLPGHEIYLTPEWLRANVSSKGQLGELYRVWGDGKEMVEDDIFDYFSYANVTGAELRRRGFNIWTPVQEPGSWISEGDTSAFMNLIDNGLRSHEHPGWGGWGGRAVVSAEDSSEWIGKNARDLDANRGARADYAAARWFEDAQLDFAARLAWAVTPDFDDANHHPEVDTQNALTAASGETVSLTATATDPDGDGLTYRWWHYVEAGTYGEPVSIEKSASQNAELVVPEDIEPGQTIHVILEVADNGVPKLKRYQRVVITAQ